MGLFEFLVWIARIKPAIMVQPPFVVRPCACRDVNCRGWRLVHVRDAGAEGSHAV